MGNTSPTSPRPCIVFDLDGTLAHTMDAIADMVTQEYAGLKKIGAKKAYKVVKKLYEKHGASFNKVAKKMGMSPEELRARAEEKLDQFCTQLDVYLKEDPHIQKGLSHLKQADLWILTTTHTRHARVILEHLNLKQFFREERILGRDKVSPYEKVDPACYTYVEEHFLQTSAANIWFVDDNVHNIKASEKAGWKSLLIGDKYKKSINFQDIYTCLHFLEKEATCAG